MRYREVLAAGLCVVLARVPVYAHHSAAAVFSNDYIEIEGVVTEFNFKNPHVNIMLKVTDESGADTLWMATAPAAPPFRRWGWSADTIKVGQRLRLPGKMSRDGGPMILLEGVDIQAGNILELDPANGSIIGPVLGRLSESRSEIVAIGANLADGRPNLGGTWLGGARANRDKPPFNATGAALQAEFDAINDPTWSECSDAGLVRQAATIHPLRITQYDDRVIFEYEEFAARREILLTEHGEAPKEKTPFGHHNAHYDGDALIIETTSLIGNLTGPLGNALSDQTTTLEIYRRTDNPQTGPAISMTMIVTDPGHLLEPWEFSWRKDYTADDYRFVEVECRLPLRASE